MIPKTNARPASEQGDFFAVGHHGAITRDAFDRDNDEQDVFVCEADCLALMAEVQHFADSRGADGDKSDGRLYLHHIAPPQGYAKSAHRAVLSGLGLSGDRLASIDEFIALSEKRAFDEIAIMIMAAGGQLTNAESGQILYILATLLHAHQDYKHREGNWFHDVQEPITSVEHFTSEFHQSVSDLQPTEAMRQRAVKRSSDFLNRFNNWLQFDSGLTDPLLIQGALQTLGDFELPKELTVLDYRPAAEVMDFIFPVYETL